MTCQPKSEGKMANFETLTLCIFLRASQMCTYFLRGLSYRILSVTGKKFDSRPTIIRFQILLPTACCYGLTSHEFRVH